MTRTIENGFQLTGPIARGDWAVVEAHLAALQAEHPELEPMYRVLAEATGRVSGRVEGAGGNREVPPQNGAFEGADMRGALEGAHGPWGKQEHPRSGLTSGAPTGIAYGDSRATEPKAREAP
jgi:hypothetical protein